MEIQWPLILFTTFVAWSTGLFATQAVFALRGQGQKGQLPALVLSFVLLVVGGIAVFFHLQHWERIFNGFGHITSGITQELVAIIAMVVIMLLYLFMLRRGTERTVPVWVAVLAIVSALALVIVMGHSYMMASRPAWNSALGVCSLVGAAAAMGAGTFALLDVQTPGNGVATLVGTVLGVLGTLGFVASMAGSSSAYTQVGFYYDPTHPTYDMTNVSQYSPLASGSATLTIASVVLACLAVAFALLGRRDGKWRLWGTLTVLCAFACALLLRVVFYQVGGSVSALF